MYIEQVKNALRVGTTEDQYAVMQRYASTMIQHATALGLNNHVTISGLYTLMADLLETMIQDNNPDCQAMISKLGPFSGRQYAGSLRRQAEDQTDLLLAYGGSVDRYFLDGLSPLNSAAKDLYRERKLTYGQLLLANPTAVIVAF